MNSSQKKELQITIMYDKEKNKIFTFWKLAPGNVCHFCLNMTKMNIQLETLFDLWINQSSFASWEVYDSTKLY